MIRRPVSYKYPPGIKNIYFEISIILPDGIMAIMAGPGIAGYKCDPADTALSRRYPD